MQLTVHAVFDGEVLRPEEPLALERDRRYAVTIDVPPPDPPPPSDRPLRRYAALAQDLGVEDLAAQHDHYLYGTPKR